MKIVVTGGAGLVGTECCNLFGNAGDSVVSIDNYQRGKIFGELGNTEENVEKILSGSDNVIHVEADIRDIETIGKYLKEADAVIHTAAQPSHPRSVEIPAEDFSINVVGTFQLLDFLRKNNPKCIFIHCSTNKVYGDNPNRLALIEKETRYDFKDIDAIDENFPIDKGTHTPFGVSKTAADLYTQEFAATYGMTTGVFRMGCITGGAAHAVELHNWEPFFMMKNLSGENLNIYGYKGKQVRDVIHARDLAKLFKKFIENPKKGEVYNIGGGRKNTISLLEAISLIENMTGKKMNYTIVPEARLGDHQVYVSDIRKAQRDFDWDIEIGLEEVFREIYETLKPNYLKK
ncbi:MAG: NAD-dependent epimerase/dehydratase family protein [Candidatus Ancaeobacter aquaticus]|nr:NAD-dependent epimerase/dehydratase family protein [Candidatus Ancaeobacter aquaticus]